MVVYRTYPELTVRQQALAPLIDANDADPPSTPERIELLRRSPRYRERYEALYALQRGVPMARVASIRSRFRTPRWGQEICGVTDVNTRSDGVRQGYARLLMEETHRRARAEGVRWAFLWTRRSWGAHRLYESLGYRDLDSLPIALRRVPREERRPPRPKGYTVRPARKKDAALLDRLMAEFQRGRIGFVPRHTGLFWARFRVGWRSPKEYWILRWRGRPVGFARVTADSHDLVCREVATVAPRFELLLLDEVERRAKGRWVRFEFTTFVRDRAAEFRRRGYDMLRDGHPTLMAAPLTREARREWAELRRTVASPRYTLQDGDRI